MKNIMPENKTNCSKVVERHSISSPLPMINYETFFNYYAEELSYIGIQKKEHGSIVAFNEICRIRKWSINNYSHSWSIFANDRENIEDIVVRKITWDMQKDKESIKTLAKKTPQNKSCDWPSISTQSFYLPKERSSAIINKLSELDNIIKFGILLSKNPTPNWEWKDLELIRTFDWGQVHSIWSTHMKNQDIENAIGNLEYILDDSLSNSDNEAETIYLNYFILPEEYKLITERKRETR